MNRLMLAAAVAASLVMAVPALAQFAKVEDAIKYRKSVMFMQDTHLRRLSAMANGRAPYDAKVAAENADILLMITKLPFPAFVDGSDKGNDTRAKPEIWKEKDKFDAAANKMQEEVVKLNAAAKSGNVDQLKSAVGTVGRACKACHDDFSTL
jgi:cytochrome c556